MKYLVILWVVLLTVSCDSTRIYEDYVDMEDAFWHIDSVHKFSFEIKDTSAQHNVLASFRNASNYPFYNLYFQYSILDSGDQLLRQELKEVDLFDPKTGEPYGSGLGDLFDHLILLEEQYEFPYQGKYSIALQQFMRMDTLPFILSVGARVERSE